jgi:putative hydrolase of the HAD superfamily
VALGRVDAVLLDAFGTLVAMEPPAPRLRAELAARGFDSGAEAAADAFRAEIAYYLEHQLEGRDPAALDDLRDRCADVLREALALPGLDRSTARAALLGAIRFRPFADAAPALRELREHGLRLVVASNWDCSLPSALRDAGLLDLLDGVVSSAEVGARKPDARLFARALELAAVPAECAVHVGDSLANDVAGAAAAGIRPVLLRRGGERLDALPADAAADVAPAVEIASLAELPRVL